MIKLNPENLIDRIIAFWQTEDILRANHFNVASLKQKQPELSGKEMEWLENMAAQMRDQNVLEKGHISESMSLLALFEKANSELNEKQIEAYKPLMDTLDQHPESKNHRSKVQTAFEILYGYFLKRVDNKTMYPQVEILARAIGEWLTELSEKVKVDDQQ
ncbi:MAG: DUF4924 family protein [Bacteroidetes bacterium]|nr:DUF4924 family protein [Bacteroidota bacterium]